MKNILKFNFYILTISIFIFSPIYFSYIYAVDGTDDGLVNCGTDVVPPKITKGVLEDGTGVVLNSCEFKHFIELIQKVIDFVLFKLLMPITAILFAYAGFLLLFSGGNSSKKDKAKKIFINVAIGFIIALGAWLLVKTILNLLGFQSDII